MVAVASDKEPIRYYDWMLWKMRQDDKKQNMVDNPPHYTRGNIECIEYIKDSMGPIGFTYFCEGNVKKYMHRFRDKNKVEDIRKAAVYMGWLAETLAELEESGTQLELSL